MFYISDCCRICLQYDKNLLDITSADKTSTETLLSKLKVCVSEVEWSSSNLLLCQSCITKLNSSYEFKKQCILSSETWKKYMELVRETQNKLQTQVSLTLATASKEDDGKKVSQEELVKAQEAVQNAILQVAPNQKLLKLYVGGQGSQNVIPNIFLNLVPTGSKVTTGNLKEVNQSIFLNINNTFQKISPGNNKTEDVNVSKILTESKSEELSVEIDPMDFECLSEESPMPLAETNDWEELINSATAVPKLIPISNNKEQTETVNGKQILNTFIPILPKPENLLGNDINQEKYEFFNSGHFLTPKESLETESDLPFPCEVCNRNFESLSLVRFHVKQLHSGKFPYKCEFCFGEFAAKSTFESHVLEKHGTHVDASRKDSLTLQDFPTEENVVKVEFENGDPNRHACEICCCTFSTANGLIRHKSRKHNQNPGKKKYFVKGMKNARCEICKRDFSTQSYLQLHLKLHQRKGPTYRGKIFRTKPINVKEGCDSSQVEAKKKSPSLKLRINLKTLKESTENAKTTENPTTNGTNQSTIYKAIFHDVTVDKEKKLISKIFNQNDTSTINCLYCNQLISGSTNLRTHLRDTHFKKIQYKCHLCNNAFVELSDLTEHLKLHYTSALCTICMQMFATETEMRTHNGFLHSDSAFWQCGVCYVILTIRELKDHMKGHGETFNYVCHFCGDEVVGEEEFKGHIARHNGDFVCVSCGLKFEYEYEKRDHDVDRHGKKYFDCILCGKKYNCLHELTRHRNLHQWHPHLLQNNKVDELE